MNPVLFVTSLLRIRTIYLDKVLNVILLYYDNIKALNFIFINYIKLYILYFNFGISVYSMKDLFKVNFKLSNPSYTSSNKLAESGKIQLLANYSELKELASRLTETEDGKKVRLQLDNGGNLRLSREFIEWFRGIVDSEGYFGITKGSGNSYKFMFRMDLHIDDAPALEYIKTTLGLGSIYNFSSNRAAATKSAIFTIFSRLDISIILAIFSKYSLNSSKHLNFLAFAKAYMLYNKSSKHSLRAEINPILDKIAESMNSKRKDFVMPSDHRIVITNNWLLGFVEGDGSFFYTRGNKSLGFSISQEGNKALMEAIVNFLCNYASEQIKPELLSLNLDEIQIYSIATVYNIKITRRDLIKLVIIPLFSSVNFRTKKFLDFMDWVAIFNLHEKGLHYLPEGKHIIKLILNQMNNNRLSTRGNVHDRTELLTKIEELLSKPSNYEYRNDGKFFIISEQRFLPQGGGTKKGVELIYPDGTLIKTFKSLGDCAKFLVLDKRIISSKIQKGDGVNYNNQLCILRNINYYSTTIK